MPRYADTTRVKNKIGRSVSPERDFLRHGRLTLAKINAGQWPDLSYIDKPVEFFKEKLGAKIILDHQIEMAEALWRDPRHRVAVSSGQKIGKTFIVACIAWAFWSTRNKAKITITMTTESQVDSVIYDEIKNVYRMALANGVDLLAGGSTLAENPRTGIEALDGRVMRGLTVRQVEAMGGISGENLLFIADEASALSGKLAEAIAGNTMGDGWMLWTSNPTQSEGPFYDAFHKHAKFWATFYYSSEDIANQVRNLGLVIKGVATPEQIKLFEEMFGRDSPFFQVRVLGKFLQLETGKINSLHLITEAQKKYQSTPDEGDLSLGVDTAGENQGDSNDKWVFQPIRGHKALTKFAARGLTPDAGLEQIKRLFAILRRGEEIPRVIIDTTHQSGMELWVKAKAYISWAKAYAPREVFEVYGIRSSNPATREPHYFMYARDELWKAGHAWLAAGGAIDPADYELAEELHAPRWKEGAKGKWQASDKEKEIRPMLGRSPDSADALNLAAWSPTAGTGALDASSNLPRALPPAPHSPSPTDPFAADGQGGTAIDQSDWAWGES